LVEEAGGVTTLAFAPVGAAPATSAAALTLARQLSESPPEGPPPSMSEVAPDQPAPAPAPGPAPHPKPNPNPNPQPVDLPQIYEYVVDHLRRDLLVERERMGDLLGELP
jgi:hypothetical protein